MSELPLNEEEESNFSQSKSIYNSSKNRRIPIAVKLEAIEYAKKTSNYKAGAKFNVSENAIRYWRKQENVLRKQGHQISKITLHKGKNSTFIYDEKEMWLFTETNRKLGNPLTTWALIIELLKREPTARKMSKNSLLKWCSRFENKFYLSFKISKQESKLMLADALHQLKIFFEDIKNKRCNENIDTIVSVDEIPLFFNMRKVKRSIRRGIKDIIIETQKLEDVEVSVLLSISSDGNKLPPLVIFKRFDKKDEEIEKNLKELAIVKKGFICLEFNDNAWCNNYIMEQWFQKVYWPYLFKYSTTGRGLILLDMESSHFTKEFLEFLNSRNQLFSLIPAGLTRIVQPIDVKINKPFITNLKSIYDKACNNAGENLENIRKDILLDWITNSWYDDDIIRKQEIYDSFKYCGISNSLDGKENNLIRNFDEITECVVKQDFTKDEKEDNSENQENELEDNKDEDANQSYALDDMNNLNCFEENKIDIDLPSDL